MIGRFFRLFFALLLSQIVLFFLFLFFIGALVAAHSTGPVTIKDSSALWIHLSGELLEYPTLPTVPFLHEVPVSQTAILEQLERAATDPHIESVLLDLDFPSLGWGMANEMRQAIQRFRNSGKPVRAYSAMYDEVGLYLASACDSIFAPPQGKVMLNGLAYGAMFYKGLFDKAGLKADVHRIGAYKSAVEPYVRSSFSEPARRNADWLLDGIWSEFQTTVATDRKLAPAALAPLLAQGTLQPESATAAHLIDGVRQRQDLTAPYADDDGTSRLVSVQEYRHSAKSMKHGRAVAVVHTHGFILSGKNSYNPVLGTVLGDQSVVRDLDAAARDKDVAAIVLRIDSPGGDALASDAIGHAVARAKASKPVVVSMVDVAASGGYMMAYRASRIVALPTTITGSIGSITGKLNAHGLYDKLGLTKDFVTRGAFPFLYSDYHEWTAAEESLVVRQHWQDYRRWVADIASQRGLAAAEVDSVGRGRVWSGQQALDRKLVDEMGDMRHAVTVAAELGQLPAGTVPRLVHYPKEMGLLDVLEERSELLAIAAAQWMQSVRLPQSTSWSVLEMDISRP
jgi:protease-4